MRQGIYTQILISVIVLSTNVYSSCFTHTVCTNQCTYVLTKVVVPSEKKDVTQFTFRYTNRQKCYRCETNQFHLNFEGFVNNIMKNYFNIQTILQLLGRAKFEIILTNIASLHSGHFTLCTNTRQFMYPLQRTDIFRAQSTGCTAFRMSQLSLWENKLLYILDKISTDRTVKHRPSMWVDNFQGND